MGLNDKNIGTTSNKIRKCSTLIKYIYEKLVNDNEIQRMLYYNTINPLSQKGKNYNGEIISQPDLSAKDMKGIVFDIPFNPEMDIELSNYLYVNLKNGKFNSRQNSLYFDINILVPEDFISMSNGYRHFEIAQRVADIFDDIYITEKDYVDDIGNVQPVLCDMPIYRLSKSNNFIWVNMQFEVELINNFTRVRC